MSTKHHCVSCGRGLTGTFCSQCGEKRIEEHDLTIRHFIVHAFEAFTHADGKIFATMRLLLFRPGQLTADYITGRRRAFIGPLQLFLICNVLYFLLHTFVHWDSLSSTLQTNMTRSFFKEQATAMIQAHLAASGLTLEQYRPLYDDAAVHYGKSLVFLLVPLFTVPLAILFHRKDRPLLLHLTFALHFCAFFLVALSAMHVVSNLALALLRHWSVSPTPSQIDAGSSLPVFLAFAWYLFAATGRVYGDNGLKRILKAGTLLVLVLPLVTAFRFVLLLVTLWTT